MNQFKVDDIVKCVNANTHIKEVFEDDRFVVTRADEKFNAILARRVSTGEIFYWRKEHVELANDDKKE